MKICVLTAYLPTVTVKWGRSGVGVLSAGGLGVRALRSSPEQVEDGLGGGQDIEGHRQCQALSEVG